jgi:hypothetical protein
MSVKRENWKHRYIYVVRSESGKIVSWKAVKGSKLNINNARAIFQRNNTFDPNVKRTSTKLTNMTEIVSLSPSSLAQRNKKVAFNKPSGKSVQYIVQGRYKNKTIVARSGRIGSPLAQDSKEAKSRAWENFINRLSEAAGYGYDEDEGVKLMSKVSNIQEGWVAYR